MAGETGGSHPGPGETSHALLQLPLTCRKCGGKLKIVAYLHDTVAIKQVLDRLGLSPPDESKPPPAVHEVVRVPVDEEGREIEAS